MIYKRVGIGNGLPPAYPSLGHCMQNADMTVPHCRSAAAPQPGAGAGAAGPPPLLLLKLNQEQEARRKSQERTASGAPSNSGGCVIAE